MNNQAEILQFPCQPVSENTQTDVAELMLLILGGTVAQLHNIELDALGKAVVKLNGKNITSRKAIRESVKRLLTLIHHIEIGEK